MLRTLTNDEIENMVNFILPRTGIPKPTALSICERNKERLRKQLRGKLVYPEIIPQLKLEMEKSYHQTLVHPGEAVGVICAQSIGEKNTQTALNTFHKAGQSEKTMTEGVPRFQELLNATKTQKMVNHKIFFTHGTDNVKDLRSVVGNTITCITIRDLTTSCDVFPDKRDEVWYKPYKIMYPPPFDDLSSFMRINLKTSLMFEYKITEQYIVECIENQYDDLYCITSPYGFIDVFVNPSDIRSRIEEDIAYISQTNIMEVYMEDVVENNLMKLHICGIPCISEIFYSSENGKWFVETNASNSDPTRINNLQQIMSLNSVDDTQTTSNNIWEIYETLGVEATKAFLVEEFMNIMDGINECHARLLVDRMTFGGSVASISRYTLKTDECGPMGKASFEESLDNFLNAAAEGEVEPTIGISASIICGKRSNIGTGIMGLKMKLSK
jgi:DNA-directed RNA polymerase beta' subunit